MERRYSQRHVRNRTDHRQGAQHQPTRQCASPKFADRCGSLLKLEHFKSGAACVWNPQCGVTALNPPVRQAAASRTGARAALPMGFMKIPDSTATDEGDSAHFPKRYGTSDNCNVMRRRSQARGVALSMGHGAEARRKLCSSAVILAGSQCSRSREASME